MNKTEFLTQLEKSLHGLSPADIAERLNFYSEMIDDSVEEGLSEDDAVSRIGSADEIAAQIIAESPLSKPPVKNRTGWHIALIAVGSPIWLSLLIAAIAVVLAVYVCMWAVVICLWAAFASICGSGFGFTICGIGLIVNGDWQAGLAMIGAGLVLAGLSILAFYGCRAVTKAMGSLTKKSAKSLKNRFKKKEAAK